MSVYAFIPLLVFSLVLVGIVRESIRSATEKMHAAIADEPRPPGIVAGAAWDARQLEPRPPSPEVHGPRFPLCRAGEAEWIYGIGWDPIAPCCLDFGHAGPHKPARAGLDIAFRDQDPEPAADLLAYLAHPATVARAADWHRAC
jgi:hypothetical protein